jgi:ATP-dependent RNA helicase SUPV3L1/SUV3
MDGYVIIMAQSYASPSNLAASGGPLHDRPSGRLVAVLGPTNTGKTHYALERMAAHATGMIGLPLRLLAREIYDRMVTLKGINAVALITGEEKIIPRLPSYFVCTVEAMPLERQVDFLAVDEIQLCADTERGHVFTDRLLHARGRHETLFMGAKTFAPLFKRLFPHGEIIWRERLSALSFSGPKKLTRLPKRTAIVAFSTEKVYAIAELIRRQRGGAAVVMGSLSPKTRNAQVDLFQRGEVDFLVATDAIGLGLNMDIAHVAFSALSKYDGKRTRHLTAQEIAQIAGRAGRFTREGTFGLTADCEDLDEDLIHQVENHHFPSIEAAHWRNATLDFSSVEALLHSLTQPSNDRSLVLAKEAIDERTLRHLLQDEDIAHRARNPVSLRILWDVCQLPDFRKIGFDEHVKLVEFLFASRMSHDGCVPEDWFAEQITDLDKMNGDVDTLSSRLSGVRTLSYIANRGNWLKRVEHWREVTRDLEARLSDALHEALMQRFIDAKTGALLRALHADEAPKPEVTAAGEVIIEGHVVGSLKGLDFKVLSSASMVEEKALRQAAHKAVGPLVVQRLKDLSQAPSKALKLRDQRIYWQNEPVAKLEPSDFFAPKVKLLTSHDQAVIEARVVKRLSDFVRQIAMGRLKALWTLKQAAEAEGTPAPVRAIAFQLYENAGVLRRDEASKLTPEDRGAIKALGLHANRFVWWLPLIQAPKIKTLLRSFSPDRSPHATAQVAHSLRGEVLLPGHGAVPLKTLETLDKTLNEGHWHKGSVYLKADTVLLPELDEAARDGLMAALGYVKCGPFKVADEDERMGWRPKGLNREGTPRPRNRSKPKSDAAKSKRTHAKPAPKPAPEPYINPYSPFAILRTRI